MIALTGRAHRYLVLANPSAGRVCPRHLREPIKILRSASPVDLVTTRSVNEIGDAVGRYPNATIVVAGGDGTIHAVIQALKDRRMLPEVPIGILPMGTGNDIVRSLRLPNGATAAAQAIVSGEPQPADLIQSDSGSIAVNMVHYGIGALASARAQALKFMAGRAAYPIGSTLAGYRTRAWTFRIVGDGGVVELEGDYVLVGICNGGYFGGGYSLCTAANPNDSLLNIVATRAEGLVRQVALGVELARGRSPEHLLATTTCVAKEVEIDADGAGLVVDGDVSHSSSPRTWRIQPHCWCVIRPTEQSFHSTGSST